MDEIFGAAELWPVRLVLAGRTGWSLWGGDTGDGYDYLLSAGNDRCALFDTAGAMWRYVVDDRSTHTLSATPGWPVLVRACASGTPETGESARFDFDRLTGPHSGEWDGEMVDCLDLLRDLGNQFADPLLTDLDSPGGALRHYYDAMWGELDEEFDPALVENATRRAVQRITELAAWNPVAAPGMRRA